jgi:predicted RNase H-like nuclease (RuvC/YqgF family)
MSKDHTHSISLSPDSLGAHDHNRSLYRNLISGEYEKSSEVKRLEYFLGRKEARIQELEEQLDHASYSIALLAEMDTQKDEKLRAAHKQIDRLQLELAIAADKN